MSGRSDEIQTAVDSAVRHLSSIHPRFWVQVVFKLAVYVVDDWLPATESNLQLLLIMKKLPTNTQKEPLSWECCRVAVRFFRIINERILSVLSCSDSYQLLLSTASPNPGVSTIVSSSCTPPSFIKTLDCSTWHKRKKKGQTVFTFAIETKQK